MEFLQFCLNYTADISDLLLTIIFKREFHVWHTFLGAARCIVSSFIFSLVNWDEANSIYFNLVANLVNKILRCLYKILNKNC